jgi:hypothetical protein
MAVQDPVHTLGLMEAGPPDGLPAPPMSGARTMGWLLFVSSLFWPRLFILGFWIFGSQLGRAFDSWVVPVIGFVVAPWTTVAYAFMWGVSSDKVAGIEWLVVAAAVLADLLTWAGGRRLSH